jgi:hypothetical protein
MKATIIPKIRIMLDGKEITSEKLLQLAKERSNHRSETLKKGNANVKSYSNKL